MNWTKTLFDAVVEGRKKQIAELAAQALGAGEDARQLIDRAITPAMNEVSDRWRRQEYFIPEVMRSASTMQAGMDALKPHIVKDASSETGVRVALGTVQGDLHDIGKNLVAIMLEGVGCDVDNMGVDLPPERFVEAVQSGVRVLGMSSLLTTSMQGMQTVIDMLKESGLRDNVAILVGGAPVTAEFAAKIGADHYAADAAGAVEIMNRHFI